VDWRRGQVDWNALRRDVSGWKPSPLWRDLMAGGFGEGVFGYDVDGVGGSDWRGGGGGFGV
jgi:hypothetical protein